MVRSVGILIKNESKIPCSFCHQNVNDEVSYGPMYKIGNIVCHYFCILMSTKLIQHGKDQHGILGFLFTDIRNELILSKNKKCFYCKEAEATINCCNNSCRVQFHFPCGFKNGAMSLFYGTYQSFCHKHRKNQYVPQNILAQQRVLRVKLDKILLNKINPKHNTRYLESNKMKNPNIVTTKCEYKNDICYICYEHVVFDVPYDLFWPSCCKVDAWFHRRCISKLALSAGSYFIKCPLCNNTSDFKEALFKFGIYIPERDASWETENGAFSELLVRPNNCVAQNCTCPTIKSKSECYEMIYCKYCGSEGVHRKCNNNGSHFTCGECLKFDKDNVNIKYDMDTEEDTYVCVEYLDDLDESESTECSTNLTNQSEYHNTLNNDSKYIKSECDDVEMSELNHSIASNLTLTEDNEIPENKFLLVMNRNPIKSELIDISDDIENTEYSINLTNYYKDNTLNDSINKTSEPDFSVASNSTLTEENNMPDKKFFLVLNRNVIKSDIIEISNDNTDVIVKKIGHIKEEATDMPNTFVASVTNDSLNNTFEESKIDFGCRNIKQKPIDIKQAIKSPMKNTILEYFSPKNEEFKENKSKIDINKRKKIQKHKQDKYSITKYLKGFNEMHMEGELSPVKKMLNKKKKKTLKYNNIDNSMMYDIKKYFTPVDKNENCTSKTKQKIKSRSYSDDSEITLYPNSTKRNKSKRKRNKFLKIPFGNLRRIKIKHRNRQNSILIISDNLEKVH